MEVILTILLIQIVYVSLFTMRMIFTMRNQSSLASFISALDVLIYITGLNLVLKSLDNPVNLIVYCLGYALGLLIGSKIEEKMALGYVVIQIITQREDGRLADILREKGYGVTTWYAEGRDSNRMVLEVLTKRKHESRLFKLVESLDTNALIISQEPRNFRGGFWAKKIKDDKLFPSMKRANLAVKKIS